MKRVKAKATDDQQKATVDASPKSRAPARVSKETRLTEERVTRIVDMMATGTWVTGKSGRALAQEWGISVSRVEQLSAEASRIVKRAVGDPQAVRTMMMATLHEIVARGMKKGEMRTAIEAIRTVGSWMGFARDRLQLENGPDEFTGWTNEEIARYVETGEIPLRHRKGRGGGEGGSGAPVTP